MTANRRIILNIVATYGRSLFSLACGLFSARWVLEALGKEDFGLYGVIGALTIFISFPNMMLSGALGRFYAFSIGEAKKAADEGRAADGLENCRRWFNTALSIHMVVPVALMLIGYPIGVWAVRNFLTIPADRLDTCVWVFRLSCISSFRGQKSDTYLTYMPPTTDTMQLLASLAGVKVNHTIWSPYYLLKRGLGQTLASPLEWVKKVASSRGFVTKSFHGTLFAILMHTPFVYIRPGGAAAKRATRVLSVLERVGLLDRVIPEEKGMASDIKRILEASINWESVDAIRNYYVDESRSFLKGCLA